VLDVRTDKMSVRGMYVSTMRGKQNKRVTRGMSQKGEEASDEENVTDE
jgi:hypothetical protein